MFLHRKHSFLDGIAPTDNVEIEFLDCVYLTNVTFADKVEKTISYKEIVFFGFVCYTYLNSANKEEEEDLKEVIEASTEAVEIIITTQNIV